jgi:hypothetical protein
VRCVSFSSVRLEQPCRKPKIYLFFGRYRKSQCLWGPTPLYLALLSLLKSHEHKKILPKVTILAIRRVGITIVPI